MNIHCNLNQMDGGGEILNLELHYQNNVRHSKHPEPDSFLHGDVLMK